MTHYGIRVAPGELAWLEWFDIGPGKEFYDPGCAHFPHHLQAALNLPFLNLVGQTGVDTHNRVGSLHHLRRAGDDQRSGRSQAGKQQDQQEQYAPTSHEENDTRFSPVHTAGALGRCGIKGPPLMKRDAGVGFRPLPVCLLQRGTEAGKAACLPFDALHWIAGAICRIMES